MRVIDVTATPYPICNLVCGFRQGLLPSRVCKTPFCLWDWKGLMGCGVELAEWWPGQGACVFPAPVKYSNFLFKLHY